MRIEVRSDRIIIDGYVNAVGRESRPIAGPDGKRFIEKIMPGTFKEALERASRNGRAIKLLLNHRADRELGDTNTNLTLKEDSIGLKARAEVTDPECIQKAKDGKLRGWSFGFNDAEAEEEERANKLPLRDVNRLELLEVSIIDERMQPCYAGTSINTRADSEERMETRAMDDEDVDIVDRSEEDKRAAEESLEPYMKRINKLKEGEKA